MNQTETIILAIYVIINVFVFLLFLVDKVKAKVDFWRVPESTLVILSIFGAIGGALGMMVCHHKVSKWKFKLVYLFCLIHLAIIALILTGYIKIPSF